MVKILAVSLLLLLFAQPGFSNSGLRTFFQMQQRLWISESDLTTLLLAVGTPKCMQPCLGGLIASTSAAFSFDDSIVTGIEKVCKEYKVTKECVKNSNCGNSTIFAIFTKGLEAACGENFHLIYFVKPCLDQFAEAALTECDAQCELTMTLEQLTNNEEIKKIVAKGGNAMAVLKHLGPTCSSMTCFLACAHKGLNMKCPITGNAFVEVSLKPMEDVAQKLKGAAPALKRMVKKKLPQQCQPLLDIDYLNRLKAFGSLPDKKPSKRM